MAGFLFRFNFNVFGVVHILKGQFTHAEGEGGGEQHIEALVSGRHAAEQPANVFNEAEVKHSVSFVEYHHLDGA